MTQSLNWVDWRTCTGYYIKCERGLDDSVTYSGPHFFDIGWCQRRTPDVMWALITETPFDG